MRNWRHLERKGRKRKPPGFPIKDVFDDILILANAGKVKTIEDAYDLAVKMNPQLAETVVKTAEQNAIKRLPHVPACQA